MATALVVAPPLATAGKPEAGRGEEDVEAVRVDEKRIADRVAHVGDAKRSDRGVVTDLEAVDDPPAPQHCLVAQQEIGRASCRERV